MSKIVDIVTELARPVVEKQGCALWDVEFVKEGGQRFLRVFIDNDEGVSIDQCEAVSRELDVLLDEADPIEESYIFEVSSAGAERALKRPSDFEKFIGHKVAVRLYGSRDGRKEHIGALLAYHEGDVSIDTPSGPVTFRKSEVAGVRLRIDF